MLAFLFPFLSKFWPYVLAAAIFFFAGCFAGSRFEYGEVEAAKLALVMQQKSDVSVIAATDASAAVDLAQAGAKANAAETQVASTNVAAGAQETALTAQIASQAARTGQDAPDAPVLASTLGEIAKGNP